LVAAGAEGAAHEARNPSTRRAHWAAPGQRAMKAAVRDLTPEIKTEFRKVLDEVLPKDPELRAKIIAIYSQSPLLKKFYEEAGFEVTYEHPRD
jgi:hypothetical protein